MVQYRSLDSVRRLAADALAYGAHRPSLGLIEWDVGAYCDEPVTVEVIGRGYGSRGFNVNPGTLTVIMTGLPCRKCVRCLRVRRAQWSDRAMKEIASAERTWFCTFTLKPEVHHATFMDQMARKTSKGWLDSDFDDAQREFLTRCHGGLDLVTKFWKNLRKPQAGEEPIRIKYLVTCERHKSGLPHFHALIHERAGSCTYRRIESRWTRYGFMKANLVHEVGERKAARYVTKYVAKDMLGLRIHASLRYGLPSSPDDLRSALRAGDVLRHSTLSKSSPPTLDFRSLSYE